MDQLEFFRRVIGILQPSGLPYMVVGSYASGFYGEPRATYDVDIVIAISDTDVVRLGEMFPADEFYFSPEAARDAIRHRRQFNIIHPSSGNKIDLMVQGKGDWAHEQLARRRSLEIAPGFEASVASPEDVILGKLLFYREGGSPKHLRDITGILKLRGEKLDLAYLDRWSAKLDVVDEWETVRRGRK